MPDLEAFEKELDEARQSDHEPEVLEETAAEEKQEEVPAEEPKEEPQEEVTAEAQPEDESKEVEPEVERFTIPDHEKFGEFAGKRLTGPEIVEAGLLKQFNTLENNDVHHQKLYGELKEKYDAKIEEENKALKEAAQPQPPQVPIGEQIKTNLTHMRAAYAPSLKANAEAGAFEEGFLAMFPDLAVQLEHRFVSGNNAIEILAGKVAQQETFINALLGVVEEASNSERFTGSIDSMIQENPDRYEVLGNGEARNGFVSWMNAEDNPMGFADMAPDKITPAVLAQAFLGYIDANPNLLSSAEEPAEKVPANTGGGGGTGVTRARPVATDMDLFERAFEEATSG